MTPNEFRNEIQKSMPGYAWTVHKTKGHEHLWATGTTNSGFNRLSTLSVLRHEEDGKISYEVKSAGYGRRAKWLHSHEDGTLKRALRGLQNHYEAMENTYRSHAAALKTGRCPHKEELPA